MFQKEKSSLKQKILNMKRKLDHHGPRYARILWVRGKYCLGSPPPLLIHNRGLVYLNLSYVLLVQFFVYRTGTNVLSCTSMCISDSVKHHLSMHRGQYRLATCVQEYHSFVITRSLKDIIHLNGPIVLGSQRHNLSAADLDPHHFSGI